MPPSSRPIISEVSEIIRLWDYEKNTDLDPSILTTGSARKAWFRCKNGMDHSSYMTILTIKDVMRCGVCAGRQVLRGFNDFESVSIYESYFWDYNKNEDKPWEVVAASSQKRWFVCELGHPFEMILANIRKGKWCLYCAGLKVWRGFNDFETHFPYESYFWDYVNNSVNPWEVHKSGKYVARFMCELGHSFQMEVHRARSGRWCPVCSGKVVLRGFNDFESNCPYESYFWDYSRNNGNPWDIHRGSEGKYWFVCENGHSFNTSVKSIYHQRTWCPSCSNRRSKDELAIYSWIKYDLIKGLEVISGDQTVLPGRYEIDIYIPSLRLGFEYNGNYWHKDKGDPDGPSAQKERLAREKGVTLYTIWEDDWTSDRSTWEEFIVRAINLTQK